MKYSILVMFVVLFISCISDDVTDYTAANEEEILKYIADKELVAVKSASGLYYIINEQGTGEQPTLASNVTVTYKGYYTNGNVFDQSTANVSFKLTGTVAGFGEGITYLKEGGNATFLVPSRLGYGNKGSGPIAGGEVILFDVALISVNKQ